MCQTSNQLRKVRHFNRIKVDKCKCQNHLRLRLNLHSKILEVLCPRVDRGNHNHMGSNNSKCSSSLVTRIWTISSHSTIIQGNSEEEETLMRNRTSIRGIITAVSAVISTIQHLECHFLLTSSKTICPNHSSKCRIRSNLDSLLVLRLSTQHRCHHQDRAWQCQIPLRQTMLIIAKLNLKQASSRQ